MQGVGDKRTQALPAFHAFTRADTTGRFARLGKQSGYRNARKLMTTWRLLCKEAELSEDVFTSLTRFVCSAYCPSDINISNIPELRWHLFCENMAEYDRLHPTVGALRQHIMRVHTLPFLTMQTFLDPLKHGCHKVNWSRGPLKPTTTDVLQALKTVTEMVRCQCKTD